MWVLREKSYGLALCGGSFCHKRAMIAMQNYGGNLPCVLYMEVNNYVLYGARELVC